MGRISVWLILVGLLQGGTHSDYLSAKQKVRAIESDRLKPGTRVTFTSPEITAFVAAEAKSVVPEGFRDPKVELGEGEATGTAWIDFGKIRRAQGQQPGWLLSKLLDGEHPVLVRARMSSGSGRATVNVLRVEVSGVGLEGRPLDFLIQTYLKAYYPEAKVDEPFELGHRIDRIEVKPSGATVVIGR